MDRTAILTKTQNGTRENPKWGVATTPSLLRERVNELNICNDINKEPFSLLYLSVSLKSSITEKYRLGKVRKKLQFYNSFGIYFFVNTS